MFGFQSFWDLRIAHKGFVDPCEDMTFGTVQ